MHNITIGRYKASEGNITRIHVGADGTEVREVAHSYAGWVEGIREHGTSWILWLDADGSPVMYYGRREPNGAVIGDPVILDADSDSVAAYR
ncbi:hypothetical protein [Nocardia asiatica]|uniref:hypothetical protein n=1 Tax=Nocardia asiatica TaxID=209252 RepID=UPI002458394A|nr:hypothetical protein [Nocardia asiatica]